MVKLRQKGICFLLTLAMLASCIGGVVFAATENAVDTVSITYSEGWLETAYVEWSAYDGADWYNVYVKPLDGEYTKLDDELVREYPDYYRADALGLSAGEYVLKVVPTSGGTEIENAAAETETLTVSAYTREGFAFSDNSPYLTSNGAYNEDGTLKEDAEVIYVTNGNKDTVMINDDPTYGVGLTAILAYRQANKIKTTLCIRLLGKVDEPADIEIHTAQFQNTGNVTLEGVGDDSTIFGWIMTLKRVTNMEIRNLAMMYGGEGTTGSAIVLDTDNKNVWVHNCDFFYGAPGKDADQVKGDGAIDLKARSDYVTISYNHYWELGKTCVSGGPWENSNMYDDEAHIYITYHHNWFDHTDSRHPRCVVGSNHVYNNYYDGIAMYGIGAAMKTSVFSENNYYRNCPRPMIIASQGSDCYDSETDTYKDKGTLSGQMGGMIKSYGDVIITPTRFYPYGEEPVEGEFDAYVASSRDEVVPETVTAKVGDEYGYGTYNNFDTDPDIMYEYEVDTAEEAVEKVTKYAGRVDGGDFKWEFDDEVDDSRHDVNEELLAAILAYESELVAVGGGLDVEPEPTAEPTATPTTDPNATATPTSDPNATPTATPGEGGLTKIPAGVSSYAMDWFGGETMSAGDVSSDGYIGCYKGSGNSYKTNTFTLDGLTITRGYQTKTLSQRSYYCIPESECDITVYYYSAGNRAIALYTTDTENPVASYTPTEGGNYSISYHFTEVGSPLYIAGPDGDIYIAGVSVAANESESGYDYAIQDVAVSDDGAVSCGVVYNGAETNPSAVLIAAEYLSSDGEVLCGFKTYDISGSAIDGFDYVKLSGTVLKLYIWDALDNMSALAGCVSIE